MTKTKTTISDRNYGQICYLDNFLFLPPVPHLTMLKNNKQKLRQAMLWVRNIV